jgi:8-oxo-dGTP diphosphatase
MTVISNPDFVPQYTAAYILLRRGDTYCFMRRSNTKFMDGYYGLPAGKVMAGEPITRTVLRELEEETGLKISEQDAKLAHVVHRYDPDQVSTATTHWIDFYYVVDQWNGEPIIAEPDKCDDLKWMRADAAEKIVPYSRDAILNIENNQAFSLSGPWPDTLPHAA